MPKKKRVNRNSNKNNNFNSNLQNHLKTVHKQIKHHFNKHIIHNFNKHITPNFNKHITRHIKHHSKKIHQHLVHHYQRRKHIELDELPKWKRIVLEFNHKYLHWLEHIVEHAIPWLVLILLFIIIAEFGNEINHVINLLFHRSFHTLAEVAEIAEKNHATILAIDKVIISFFVVDLYFNFFKKATLKSFFRTYFIDVIAVLPLGLALETVAREIGGAQSVTHVVVDTERIAARAAKTTRMIKLVRAIARLSRAIKLYRLHYFFVSDKRPKYINNRQYTKKKNKNHKKKK